MNFSSKLIEDAVDAFAGLPSIGKKTALRLVLHLISRDGHETREIADALVKMRANIKECKRCHNISDDEICNICLDPRRDPSLICVVESIRDVMAIESTAQYNGLYHVLGGVISPIEGIGPEQLTVEDLTNRAARPEVKEVIMAVSPTIEGDTTIFYLSKQLKDRGVRISTIARGISFGGELEYADEMTLGRSIATRRTYQTTAGSGE